MAQQIDPYASGSPALGGGQYGGEQVRYGFSDNFDPAQQFPAQQSELLGMGSQGWGLTADSVRGVNKIVSAIMSSRQMDRDRKDNAREFESSLKLSRKAMILNYLLGKRDYSDKLRMVTAQLSSTAKKRGEYTRQQGARRVAQTTR